MNDRFGLEPFEEGFSRRTVWGALFVAAVMTPGSIYLGLVAGQTLGAASEWVTLILFTEVARRSLVRLKRQEVFILFYVASALSATALGHLALSGGPFAVTIWGQYLVQSPQTEALAEQIPDWVVPPVGSLATAERNLIHPDWWWSSSRGWISAMSLLILGQFLGRVSYFSLGYLLFRITSDREQLPFPLAPIAAEGATALAESTEKKGTEKEHWRWETFSVGATLGFFFGLLYLFLPVISGLFLAKPITLFPIPFIDLTSNVESILPASLISISFDAFLLLTGMILPLPLVVGIFVSIFFTSVIGNPILQSFGWFEHWSPGNGLLVNQMILSFDFWMSVTCGLAGTVAVIGFGTIFFRGRTTPAKPLPPAPSPYYGEGEKRIPLPRGAGRGVGGGVSQAVGGVSDAGGGISQGGRGTRGDFPVWLCIAAYLSATSVFCWLAHHLVPEFPVWIILVFGFLWTPVHSYISARLIGITGSGLSVPYLRESAFVLSGYRGLDIWFAPMQTGDFGSAAQRFRELELTRTRFTSVLKAEALILPVSLITSFLFWWGFWKMNQIPSDSFPFISRTWPVQARQAYLILTANAGEHSLLLDAMKPELILSGCIGGFLLFSGLWLVGLPTTVFYGMVAGTAMPLHIGLLLILGALVGRYVFRRKFGEERWTRMVPVVTAGFACGMGLAGMLAVGGAILSFCTKSLPF